MSAAVQAFFEKVSEDADLRHKVESIQQPSVEAAAEAIAALAREHGFDLTAKDFLPSEMSEDDLAGIAGGFSYTIPKKILQEDGTTKTVRVVYNSNKDNGLGLAGPLSDYRPDLSIFP